MMNKIEMFIELLKLESRKASALADLTKKEITNNAFSEQQRIRSNAFLECIEYAELLLKNGREQQPLE